MENLEPYQLWLLMGAVAYAAFLFGRATAGGASPEEREHKRMEQRQQAAQLFSSLSPDAQQQVDERIRAGKIIEAIKIVREYSGAGLRESKLAVDARRASMGAL